MVRNCENWQEVSTSRGRIRLRSDLQVGEGVFGGAIRIQPISVIDPWQRCWLDKV